MDSSVQLALLLKALQSIFRSISTFFLVNVALCSIFFLLSLYQEYNLDLYNFLFSFILYGSLISFSLEFVSLILGLFLLRGVSLPMFSTFLKLILLLTFFLIIFTISIWMRPYEG